MSVKEKVDQLQDSEKYLIDKTLQKLGFKEILQELKTLTQGRGEESTIMYTADKFQTDGQMRWHDILFGTIGSKIRIPSTRLQFATAATPELESHREFIKCLYNSDRIRISEFSWINDKLDKKAIKVITMVSENTSAIAVNTGLWEGKHDKPNAWEQYEMIQNPSSINQEEFQNAISRAYLSQLNS